MSEKYKEYCMKFSNEEIRAYMVDIVVYQDYGVAAMALGKGR